MKAFWWFEEKAIAGMARPGFNCTRWTEFSLEEAAVFDVLSQMAGGTKNLDEFSRQVQEYGAKILRFYRSDPNEARRALATLQQNTCLQEVLENLSVTTHSLEYFQLSDSKIRFQFSRNRLEWEIDYLKAQGIQKIISLTEEQHNREVLEHHFSCKHFSINDLDAPPQRTSRTTCAAHR